MQGRILGGAIGAIAPLKPKKVNLSTMILYNSENNILDVRLFVVHCLNCFVTTVLQSILHLSYSSIAVMRLDCQILLKLPPPPLNFLAGSAPGMMWPQQTISLSSQYTNNTVAHEITHKWSRDLAAWYNGS